MEIEYYKERKEVILREINELKTAKRVLDSDFIKANAKFKIGDRVYSKTEKCFGFVIGYELGYLNSFNADVVKEKKDGTQSKVKMYNYGEDNLMIANSEKL